MTRIELKGAFAAPGYARGSVFMLDSGAAPPAASSLAGGEEDALRDFEAALNTARIGLKTLCASLKDEEAEGIVEFQIAMLEDESVSDPARSAIKAGQGVEQAWRDAIQFLIDDYVASDDAYFRERASDLIDMRDRVVRALRGEAERAPPPGAILLGEDLSPTRFLSIDWSHGGGVALVGGSPTAHVAILARSKGVPLLVGLDAPPAGMGGEALLDAAAGRLIVEPNKADIERFETRRQAAAQQAEEDAKGLKRPALTLDGARITIYVNAAAPEGLDAVDPEICDGIGLTRTEFLFDRGAGGALPGEEAQYAAYRRLVDWARGRPVTIRTLDAGGDKPIPGVTVDGEANPFLGVRGARLSLLRPDLFKIQLRAVLRAAADGPVKIMIPMVTAPEEMAQCRVLLEEARQELLSGGQAAGEAPLGMMVEVPAAAISIQDFDADFYSIGSNDLIQYVTACSRDSAGLTHLARADAPAVLELISRVAAHGRAVGKEVSLCGDMAGDVRYTDLLLAAGLTALSMAPTAVAAVKGAIGRAREAA